MTEAAGIGITYFTSYYALVQRANIQPGETLLVLGAAGGVGSTAVELLKHIDMLLCQNKDKNRKCPHEF